MKATGENCRGKSKLTSEVRRMCYAISRGKNSKNRTKNSWDCQQLQSQFESEVSKWREIFLCILVVVLFLSERQLPFRGSTTECNNPSNGLFLGNLELLSGHNKILKSHLDEVKKYQESNSRMQAHYLSPRSQNEFIDECSEVVLNTIVEEVKQALYYDIIVDGTPDVFHTHRTNNIHLKICELE